MGLRLDGLLALDIGYLIVSVLGNISSVSDGLGKLVNGEDKSPNKIDAMKDIDFVPSNVLSAFQESLFMCLRTMKL